MKSNHTSNGIEHNKFRLMEQRIQKYIKIEMKNVYKRESARGLLNRLENGINELEMQ